MVDKRSKMIYLLAITTINSLSWRQTEREGAIEINE